MSEHKTTVEEVEIVTMIGDAVVGVWDDNFKAYKKITIEASPKNGIFYTVSRSTPETGVIPILKTVSIEDAVEAYNAIDEEERDET